MKIRTALLLGVALSSVTFWAGCGDSSSTGSQPVVVQPDVPPTEANKDSMDAYLREHPGLMKGGAKK